ncbi:hypothetical protein [Paenibacillus sp. FSL M7-1046]|uniref:hypothetical protein n=1 Tax=Paenibacillus sp. FSL M7-1046 TaxID=2975315 RepID=UPI0030F9F3D7
MNTRKIGAIAVGAAALIVVVFTIYKVMVGKDVGFNEIITIATLLMMFFPMITWGSKADKDGIFEDDELGKKITERSSKISYFLLLFFILAALVADEIVNETMNIFLLGILGLAMITLPIVEFLVSKKYR